MRSLGKDCEFGEGDGCAYESDRRYSLEPKDGGVEDDGSEPAVFGLRRVA